MKSWRTNWEAIVPIFKFSPTLRTIVYTTNAIESFNATYRQLNRKRSVFPNDTALLKALFLATELASPVSFIFGMSLFSRISGSMPFYIFRKKHRFFI